MFYKKIPEIKKDLAYTMLKAGKSYREVAGALEISVGSVHNIAREPREEIAPLVGEIRARFATKCFLLADHILDRINDFNVMNASLKEKVATSLGLMEKAIALEKKLDAAQKEAEQRVNTQEAA